MPFKVLSIVGTRPQFVKEAALSPHLRKMFKETLVNTGQHYDVELCREQFDALEIPEPDFDLEVGSGSHAIQTSEMMIKLEDVMDREKPDMVILYGDTNSTLAGALVASKMHFPIAHVEAGPRQHRMEIPEEINRVITDRLSTLLFAPDSESVNNLRREGIETGVHLTGDVMFDIFLDTERALNESGKSPEEFGVERNGYILLTLHRPHNSDDRETLNSIMNGVLESGETVLFPIHPRTQNNLERTGMLKELKNRQNLKMIKPVHYMDMVLLMKNSRLIVTDSGGVNKEAYFCGVPCICVDFVSAWPKTVEAGWCVCTGSNKGKIASSIKNFNPEGERPLFFGDGNACPEIVKIISETFC
ncbi:MAG: UDP-N-acetylglucosamine 2-epimerase (non-hydrolyzing) [Actinobacteria bacterium]|nr:UDP-N-acetylglucosamine 2-epimerase (non-hydrolyzing) [Actinomycetota bacterium]